ncbi:hypothetical protein OIU77_024755 [Salix suchowensis]|uniref:Uncharacterized protein n=1 Tax=Salix suchowensis TaxID=1278906 RepID=A0ABQ9BXX2_9ROSI|nr:hypothetical protein OIU77_024755 [Salix suchowensis]
MAVCASSKAFTGVLAIVILVLPLVSLSVEAQSPAPAPTSDGTTIDQGNRIPADARGSSAHIPDSSPRCFILQFLLIFFWTCRDGRNSYVNVYGE